MPITERVFFRWYFITVSAGYKRGNSGRTCHENKSLPSPTKKHSWFSYTYSQFKPKINVGTFVLWPDPVRELQEMPSMQLLLCKHDRWLKLLHLILLYRTFLFPSFIGGIQNPRLGQIEYLPYFPVLFLKKTFFFRIFISKPITYWARRLPPRPPKRPNFFSETFRSRSLAASQLTGAACII